MRHATHQPHGTQAGPASRLRRLGLMAALLGVCAIPLVGGSVAGQTPTGDPTEAAIWSGWLQRHLELEYPAGPAQLVVPGTIGWAQHLELEYAS